jgi:hypothetical protein
MQHNLLQVYAPHATALVYRPQDTGNPGQDFARHLTKFDHRRIDIEDTMLVGDSIVVRIEPDLSSPDEREAEAKIVSVLYAEKVLGSNRAAVDFVRYVKTIAGDDARGRDLQVIASYYYEEVKRRTREISQLDERDEECLNAHQTAVEQVLMEMSLWAIRLEAVTVTSEAFIADGDDTANFDESFCHSEEELSTSDRQALFMERASEILDERLIENPFQDELRFVASHMRNMPAQGAAFTDELQFQSYLNDLADKDTDETVLEALQESHERMAEQYDENGVVSLHMSDGEKVVVLGTLDDDVDELYLPEEAQHLAAELHAIYVEGEEDETISNWIEIRLNDLYGDPSQHRVARTARGIHMFKTATRMRADGTCNQRDAQGVRTTSIDMPFTIKAYPNWAVRSYAREVLEKLLEAMKRDFHLRALSSNSLYTSLHERISNSCDTGDAIAAIKEAYQAKEAGRLSLGLFTALNTTYKLQRARLETVALTVKRQVTRTVTLNAACFANTPLFGTSFEVNETRRFVITQPILARIRSLKGRDLPAFAEQLNTLPRQERDRVREAFATLNPELYVRASQGILDAIRQASMAKRGYFRFAFYEDRKVGKCNVANHVIHCLRAEDKARAWEVLKSLSAAA